MLHNQYVVIYSVFNEITEFNMADDENNPDSDVYIELEICYLKDIVEE